MDWMFQQGSLVVITALFVRIVLACFGRPRHLVEPAAMAVILLPTALVLQIEWVYAVVNTLAFVLSIGLLILFLLGMWFYVLEPAMGSEDGGGYELGTWNLRLDYIAFFGMSLPVAFLLLTYRYFGGFFDFTLGRLLPLVALTYLYYQAILKQW